MKRQPPDSRNALSALRLSLALSLAMLIPLLLYGSAPSWWSQRGVLAAQTAADDYAPANQGQLKNIAKAAVAEMDAKLSGGAGETLHQLVASWSSSSTQANDFAPVNLGQLKNVAKPFYDRLITTGLTDFYPWMLSFDPPDDFAVANVGQVKNLFSFEIPVANVTDDPLGDRLAAGQDSGNLALEDRAVWSWATHISGAAAATYPRRLDRLPSIRSVSAGEQHFAALAGNGTVWTWGRNPDGQLGDGTNKDRSTPAQLTDLADIKSVKAGGRHTLVMRGDGTVLAWGNNEYGQLGNGDTTGSALPTLVRDLINVRKIAAGYQRSVALRDDGTVWVWGYDHYAWQIDRDLFNTTPVLVPNLTDVVDVVAGYEHNVALKSDGTVWAWGSNYSNQIGDGSSSETTADLPVRVANLAHIVKLASSYDHTLALDADGTVWAWGANFFGQLGDGTTQGRLAPVHVASLSDIVDIAAAYSYSLAMKADGTVLTWGNGAVGILPGADKRVPQLVPFGLSDANNNGMDDRWELQYLGGLGQTADADPDGDGLSNLREFVQGTDPLDYFNGTTPIIDIAGGNNQIGDPGAFLVKPFSVRVRNAAGQFLTGAPVTFAVVNGTGALALTPSAPKQQSLLVRTGLDGEAKAYHVLPQSVGTSTRTTVGAGKSGASASVTFRSIVKFSSPPLPTPPPPPGGSPPPTPNATPLPPAPYRYTVIDLGKELIPWRIANNGTVLLSGTSNNQFGYFRWKGGVLEPLTYAGNQYAVEANDMNDDGVIVGVFYQPDPWKNNAENELEAALKWSESASAPVKISSPLAIPNNGVPLPGSVRQAAFTAINNQNQIYGLVRTGVVRGLHDANYIPVLNAYSWPPDLGSPTALSFVTAQMESATSGKSLWQGTSDTVLRASSSGHYIGRKFTPSPVMFGTLQGTTSGMVDGQSVSYIPVDINEDGTVVGSAGASMIVSSPPAPQLTIDGASPVAINAHTRPALSSAPQASPAPTPIAAPQILAWSGNAIVIWERQEDGRTWHPFGLEEMIPNMDGWTALNPRDMNDSGTIVGTGWYADPSNPQAQGEYHAFLLVPVELMVDGNRDGEMSFDDPVTRDSDQTNEDKPYRFWLNNDHDEERAVDSNDREQDDYDAGPDFDSPAVLCERDLEDWSRLWISFKGMVGLIKSPGTTVELAWQPNDGGSVWPMSDGHPGIKIMLHDSQAGAGATNGTYLLDKNLARIQAHGVWGGVIKPVNSSAPCVMPIEFMQLLSEERPYLYLLFEGWTPGKGQLVINIRKDGRKIAAYPAINLDLRDVKDMYERYSVGDVPGANISMLSTVDYSYWPTDRPTLMPLPSGGSFSRPVDETNNYILWVHGWNMSIFDKDSYGDTAFKRLFWQGYKGRFGTFRWPTFFFTSDVPPVHHFDASEHRAWASSLGLLALLNELNASPFSGNIRMMAHSLGNVVASEALRRSDSGQVVHTYVASQAAISAHFYDVAAPAMQYDASLGPTMPNVYGYYWRSTTTSQPHEWASENSPSYMHPEYLNGKVGRCFNYYNEDDWALTWPRWQLDQQTKPDADYGYERAGFSATRGFWRDRGLGATWLTFPSDRYEIFAWAAESYSYALGAQWVAGIVDRNIDLKAAPFDYGQAHKFHSGQFRGTNADRRRYWEKFLIDCRLKEP